MNREAEKIDFEYATAYLQAKDITGSVSAVFADGFSYIESNGAHFVDWESVQKLGMNHLDNLIHDAPKKVQEQSTKNSTQRETVQNDVERE